MSSWVVITVAAALLLLAWLLWKSEGKTQRADDWEPLELRGAQIIHSEKRFAGGEPRVAARVDRAYRLPTGLIVLVEFKTRAQLAVHASDVIELSAQRVAMAAATGEDISTRAYVVVEAGSTRARKAIAVQLMEAEAVRALIARRQSLLSLMAEPTRTRDLGLCARCSHAKRCCR